MVSLPIELTPQERLAISRKAIVRHMNRHHRDVEERLDSNVDQVNRNGTQVASSDHNLLEKIKYAVRMWWHRHPASAAVELASPFLRDYASLHPFKLLGISAATGAALVIVRPWRMMSASALLVATVKSSGLSNTLFTMLSSLTRPSGNTDKTL
ncbi:hypothetical protein [Polaromonas sp. CG_9.11]|uniref:hypothetical protein n=1 Tax=Polaromonas sp. CG_9.11 TaxID=2787730 RepID=UPI00056D09FC|nr:hypothetical protein [Polaromonas sp. CG_9.11]MBG6077184.1 ElaB/YqjD/DUF883 family membrane-anchored ribosome-binding protein [Polaromonas sp. CG_9.11]